LQIKKLDIAGFKSFMNPVGLDFGGGITAILGPNGCGKSNVVDAVRWVLGEQSAKQLRGEKMQNVVFGGTRLRKPLGLAEVSVSFANNQGRLPVAYDEVKITRRLTRDGQSDYLLNGAPCRLKDIKDLITDTGAGSHGYAIIEREQVDLVVNDHEDSRRFLFEEASGIMKYRMRRKEALRKLELTEQDMLRLNDIIEEIARTVRSLNGRWAERAATRSCRRGCVASTRIWRSAAARIARTEAAELESRLEGLRAADVGEDVAGNTITARIEALRADLVGTEHAWREAAGNVEGVASRLKGAEENILVLRERSDSARESKAAAEGEVQVTESRLGQVRIDRERLQSEHAALEARLVTERETFRARKDELGDCESRHETARGELLQVKQRSFDFAQDFVAHQRELDVLQTKLEALRSRDREVQEELDVEAVRIAKLSAEHAEAGVRVDAAAEACQDRRATCGAVVRRIENVTERLEARREERADLASRLEATRSRHEMLRAMIEAYEGYGDGARALLQRHTATGRVLGTLADHVEAPAGLEGAFDVLLHDVLDALLVRDVHGGVELLRELRGERLGRATLVLRDAPYKPTCRASPICAAALASSAWPSTCCAPTVPPAARWAVCWPVPSSSRMSGSRCESSTSGAIRRCGSPPATACW
jgi:chromosome segregation protein